MSIHHMRYMCPECKSVLAQDESTGPWVSVAGGGCDKCWACVRAQNVLWSAPPPTIPASGPPICHGEMRRSEYERPGDYLCMTCGMWLSKENVAASPPKAELTVGGKPVQIESLTIDGREFKAMKPARDWCFMDGGYGALHFFGTRFFSPEELRAIGDRAPSDLCFVSSALVDQLPAGGFQFDTQGRRVPL